MGELRPGCVCDCFLLIVMPMDVSTPLPATALSGAEAENGQLIPDRTKQAVPFHAWWILNVFDAAFVLLPED